MAEPQTENVVRKLRKTRGLTQAQLAEAVGLSRAHYGGEERRDDWQLAVLLRVAKALGGQLGVTLVLNGKEFVLVP